MKVDLFSIGKFTVHSYGVMIAIGVALCILMGMKRAKNQGLRSESVLDLGILCVVTGFIGAKLLFILISLPQFLEDPLSVLGSSGFVVYGGIIVGVAAAFLYCRVKKLSFFAYFDLLAPSVSVAQAFGRLGCFLAGCCYGKETDSVFGVVFPEGSFAPAGVKLIPTQLISSAGDFAIMIILLLFSKKSKYRGDVGALYLLLYGIGRFCVELLRVNEQGGFWGLTTAQLISVLFVIISLMLFVRNRRQGKTKVAV